MDDQKPDVLALFREAVYQAGGIKLDKLTLDTTIADLALDSIAVMESIAILEDRLGIRIADEDLARLTCLRDIDALVTKSRAGATTA
jgi:acyl carrier protein